MRNFLIFMLQITLILLCGTLFAQDHVVISEILVTPTNGEFIEIYNPTAMTVDLSNYYITDATFAGGGTFYYKTVTGNGGGGNFWDFNARFPDGAQIVPGEYQTIAMTGDSLFFEQYGVLPTYEVFEDSTNFANDVPEMREATNGSIATFFNSSRPSGLTNSGEIVILYNWDGTSDLVKDVDYVVWGDKDEAVDKTGVRIDSNTDADSDSSEYNADTPIANQIVVDTNAHQGGMSWQRIDPTAEVSETTTGGNGITGHDETSEDLGAAFAEGAPTPGEKLSTSVEDRDGTIPSTFALAQNFPNPFNPETTISYKVAKTTNVKIQVYNSLGQLVKTLVAQKQNRGDYTIVWHGDNPRGQLVSSGVYFLKMKASDFIKMRKMVLIR